MKKIFSLAIAIVFAASVFALFSCSASSSVTQGEQVFDWSSVFSKTGTTVRWSYYLNNSRWVEFTNGNHFMFMDETGNGVRGTFKRELSNSLRLCTTATEYTEDGGNTYTPITSGYRIPQYGYCPVGALNFAGQQETIILYSYSEESDELTISHFAVMTRETA